MSLRCLEIAVAICAAAALAGCKREERRFSEPATASQTPNSISMSQLQAGTATQAAHAPYEGNAFAVSEGKRLFEWFNCSGCHADGGGAIGPPLMDEQWIYGSDPANIFATIVEGRPNGMPSFRGRIPTQQVWQLTAYVRSLSGQLHKDVAPGRSDHMKLSPSPQSTQEEQPQPSSLPPSATQ